MLSKLNKELGPSILNEEENDMIDLNMKKRKKKLSCPFNKDRWDEWREKRQVFAALKMQTIWRSYAAKRLVIRYR